MTKNVNTKAEAGRAKKSENVAQKQAILDRERAQQEAQAWQEGANRKQESRAQELAMKQDEAARKRREKAELLAQEEAALGSGGTAQAKKSELSAKKNNKKNKNDLSLLEDALVSAADKKVKKNKEKLQQQQDQAAKALLQKKEKEAQERDKMDPLLANTEQMLGDMVVNDSSGNELPNVGRRANQALMEEGAASGIDAALDITKTGSATTSAIKLSAKALYNAFEERTLPVVKADYPGLRLSQYKEKVWALWKKSPENPANQLPQDPSS